MDIRTFFQDSLPLPRKIRERIVVEEFKNRYAIGHHTAKHPTLVETVRAIQGAADKPYQVFIGPPQQSRLSIKEPDLKAARTIVDAAGIQLFVHTPYIINLSAKNDWAVELLKKNLRYSEALGCKGVVVHVGKAAKMDKAAALEGMRESISAALEAASESCPLLLETPAGQGTELLTGCDEFLNFVKSFEDKRLQICVDTCHVFACGHDPLTYINKAYETDLLRLVHYNDSQTKCGACVDRHALVGSGHIGWPKMTAVAERCKALGVPMVIE